MQGGQEFKQFIGSREEKPEIKCIQETWLKAKWDFILYGYVTVGRGRKTGEVVPHLLGNTSIVK